MALGDELRDYRIVFKWCIPVVEAFSAVHGGGRLPVAARERDQADDRDAKLATLIYAASWRNQQVRALNVNESQGETTVLS
jgi:hypothetical protein